MCSFCDNLLSYTLKNYAVFYILYSTSVFFKLWLKLDIAKKKKI